MTFAGIPLWQRGFVFSYLCRDLDLEPSDYVIAWEDPNKPDDTVKLTIARPVWLAMAVHGDILPPVDVYHKLQEDEAKPDFKRHTRGHLLHETKPVGPMTELEAIDYLKAMVIPKHVREYDGNREVVKVLHKDELPSTRAFRNAWQLQSGKIETSVTKARVIAAQRKAVEQEQAYLDRKRQEYEQAALSDISNASLDELMDAIEGTF